MNVLTQQKHSAVVVLLERGISQHEIQRKTGVDRKTVRKIAQSLVDGPSNSPMATGSPPGGIQNPPPRPPAIAQSACEIHREWIEAQRRLGRNAMAIYQDLVDHRGFTHGYNSVKRFCRALREHEPAQFDRLEFLPGEEAQVDYGEGALTLYNGKYRRPRLFVMTLRYSRYSFRKTVWQSSSEVWSRLHEEAFRYFGGCVQYIVLDNLKEGVIKPDLYEPELNRVYSAMLSHYGVVADTARVADPNRKGTVESAIQHTQSTALKGRHFDSIEEQNEFLAHWEKNWAAKRIHGRTKRQVEEMFQEEKAHLRPLPLEGFRYFTEGVRTVQDDTTVQVSSSWYAARPAAIGSQVLVRIYEHEIEIRDLNSLALIRCHRRIAKGKVELPDDERVFNPSRETHRILARAQTIGPQAEALCQGLFDRQGRVAHRHLWGIVQLARRYPNWLVEQACATAQGRGISTYKAIRALVEQNLSQLAQSHEPNHPPSQTPTSTLTQDHDLIRDASVYGDFFRSATQTTDVPSPLTTQPGVVDDHVHA